MLDWDHQLDIIVEDSKDSTEAVNATKVCILSLENGKILMKTDQENAFKISQEESETITNSFKINDFSFFKNDGIKIEETNYEFRNSVDGKLVFAKKKDLGTLTMLRTRTKVIIGFTQDGYQQSGTNLALKNFARYLEKIKL